MTEFWNRVCEPGKELKVAQPVATQPTALKRVKSAITGGELLFNDESHEYFDDNGEKYLSGSVFASRYQEKFDAEIISAKMAKKYEVEQRDIKSMWSLNGEVSTSLGTAVHNALELYGKYLQLSLKTKGTNESALHKNELIKPLVESFFNGREQEVAGYEEFVVNVDHKLCGYIDRLLIVDKDKKICRIQDYKTNYDISKPVKILSPFTDVVDGTKLGAYWLQLSFYAYIMVAAGWRVEGLDIFNLENGKWIRYEHDVVDISSEVK